MSFATANTKQVRVPENQTFTSNMMQRFGNFGGGLRESMSVLTNPQNILKLLGIDLYNDYNLAVSFVQSKLVNIPEVKDFGYVQNKENLNLFAYIDQPNEEAENKIYSIYGELLELFPNKEIDVRIVELYGRSKECVQIAKL